MLLPLPAGLRNKPDPHGMGFKVRVQKGSVLAPPPGGASIHPFPVCHQKSLLRLCQGKFQLSECLGGKKDLIIAGITVLVIA